MSAGDELPSTGQPAAHSIVDAVACPFCGILCDDLQIERRGGAIKVANVVCDKAVAGFERRLPAAVPQINGQAVSFADAIGEAAALMRRAERPLFGGLGTDVEGMRAVMALADRVGAVVDHAGSEAAARNMRVLQSTGWIMSTLTEVRNRADLLIVAGTDVGVLHPRFFERIVCAKETLFAADGLRRTVVMLGRGLDDRALAGQPLVDVVRIDCANDRVGEVLSAVRALVRGVPVKAGEVGGVAAADVAALAERCKAAAYGVVVWAPAAFDFASGDLTVQAITDLVKDLNVQGRFAGLSLGGGDGLVSAAAVCAWQSGYPLRVSYASGEPDYNPERHAARALLASGAADLLMWIASFSAEMVPPTASAPLVALVTPGWRSERTPAVTIPVGTPGIDHVGRLVRCDNVVSLPLKDLHRSELPSVARVLGAISAAL